jgi:hypothetical protein
MRRSTTLKAALLLSVVAVAHARADVSLLAIGTLNGTSDLSGLTGNLENGVPANIVGGLGSGIAMQAATPFWRFPTAALTLSPSIRRSTIPPRTSIGFRRSS